MRVSGKFVSRICPFSSIIAEARPAKTATARENLMVIPRSSTRRRWIVASEDQYSHGEAREAREAREEINDVKIFLRKRDLHCITHLRGTGAVQLLIHIYHAAGYAGRLEEIYSSRVRLYRSPDQEHADAMIFNSSTAQIKKLVLRANGTYASLRTEIWQSEPVSA